MEGSEGKLGTRLTDGLCSDDTDDLSLLYHTAGGEVASVAFCADTLAGFAGEDRTDLDLFDRKTVDEFGSGLPDLFAGLDDKFSGERVDDVVYGSSTENPLSEGLDDLVLVLDRSSNQASESAAVLLVDDHVV